MSQEQCGRTGTCVAARKCNLSTYLPLQASVDEDWLDFGIL
jgi:hypothetical protein